MNKGLPKVTVVGAGFVGATAAQRVIEKDLAHVVLIDVVEGMPQGKALDMMESASVENFDATITGTNDYKDTADSDLIIITAGLARKPGMSRDDLLLKNAEIMSGIVEQAAKFSKDAVLLIVTNPLDVMTYLAWKRSGFEAKKVIGMAGVLDSARYNAFIGMELGVSQKDIRAMVLGGHGDSMVPVPSQSTVNGISITQLISKERIETINQRTRDGGAEIVKLLKTGSAYYAPSAAVVAMAEAILRDTGRILPCCVHLSGEYGIKGLFGGVPVKLGAGGVKQIIEVKLNPEELAALKKSCQDVEENVAKIPQQLLGKC
jgi:malate dehydrogenase